ncbi:MAG: hypothetical protein V1816_25460 [Pseudomonadota bacterium]
MFKKALLAVFSVLVVLTFSSPALAETKVLFKGHYRVRYWYKNNLNLAHLQKQETKSTYFDHRLRLSLSFHPSEVLSMNISTQVNKDQKWGNQKSGMDWSHKADTDASAVMPVDPGDPTKGYYLQQGTRDVNGIWDNGVEVYRLYMTILTPYGMFDVGRLSSGEAGLTVFGYYGGPFHEDQAPFCSEAPSDSLVYTIKVDNFILRAQFEKLAEVDSLNGEYDSDADVYEIIPVYTFDGGGFKGAVNCLFAWMRDRSGTLSFNSNFTNDPAPAGVIYNAAGLLAMSDSAAGRVNGIAALNGATLDLFNIWPAAQLEVGPWAFRTTFRYVTGRFKPSDAGGSTYRKIEVSGFGFYADATYSYGAGMAGLSYIYLQGDKTEKNKRFNPFDTPGEERTKRLDNIIGSGVDYCPLLVAYDVELDTVGLNDQPNHWSLVAWWDHAVTEELMVHAAYGYVYINNVPKNVKHDYGHEVDAGLKASIYGNAHFTTQFGYFIAGKYHRGAKVAGNYANKINNGWIWKNELILSF